MAECDPKCRASLPGLMNENTHLRAMLQDAIGRAARYSGHDPAYIQRFLSWRYNGGGRDAGLLNGVDPDCGCGFCSAVRADP